MTIFEALQLIKQIGFSARPVPGTSSYMIETPEGKISWMKERAIVQLVRSLKDNPQSLRATLNQIL